jgi:predicted acyl esterase
MDIYTLLGKASSSGEILYHQNIPLPPGLELPESNVFRYLGPTGMLRASRRHVSDDLSSKNWKVLSDSRTQPVQPGQVVKLEIMLWPTEIMFEAGKNMILKISGKDLGLKDFPVPPELVENCNVGDHHVIVGGEDSYLQFSTIALSAET